MGTIIQFSSFKDKIKEERKLIPEFDIKNFITTINNDSLSQCNKIPDMIFHLDSCGLFNMTSAFIHTPQQLINEVYFIPDLSDKKMISEHLLKCVNCITISKDKHRELAYGSIVKSRLLKWLMNELNLKEDLPIYYKQFHITGMKEIPLCMIIFTKFFNF